MSEVDIIADLTVRLTEARADNERLADILQSLCDLQNGPPLLRHEKKWQLTMTRAREILREMETAQCPRG